LILFKSFLLVILKILEASDSFLLHNVWLGTQLNIFCFSICFYKLPILFPLHLLLLTLNHNTQLSFRIPLIPTFTLDKLLEVTKLLILIVHSSLYKLRRVLLPPKLIHRNLNLMLILHPFQFPHFDMGHPPRSPHLTPLTFLCYLFHFHVPGLLVEHSSLLLLLSLRFLVLSPPVIRQG